MKTLYRCYNSENVLLYIGCTGEVERRLKEHSRSSPWGKDVARVDVEEVSESRALEAERKAVIEGKPLYNICLTKPIKLNKHEMLMRTEGLCIG